MSWDTAGGGGGNWDSGVGANSFNEPAAEEFGGGGYDNDAGFGGGDAGGDGGSNKRGGCFNCGQEG